MATGKEMLARKISRRSVLRGAGVTMALPWLESIPVWSAGTAQPDSGQFPLRFAAMFMACGIHPDHWWGKGAGAEMELSRSLAPMEPLKTKMNVIQGLFNKNATGVGIHPGQTGNILSGASLQRGAELKGGTSVDQLLAARLGQERDTISFWREQQPFRLRSQQHGVDECGTKPLVRLSKTWECLTVAWPSKSLQYQTI